MTIVQVTFRYEPDDADDNDATGVSSEEFDRVTERLMIDYGAENIELRRIDSPSSPPVERQRKDA